VAFAREALYADSASPSTPVERTPKVAPTTPVPTARFEMPATPMPSRLSTGFLGSTRLTPAAAIAADSLTPTEPVAFGP
jgi:hypothetical protein